MDLKLHIDLGVTIQNNLINKLFKKTFSYTEYDPGTLADEAEVEHLDGLRILYEDAYMQHKIHEGLFISFLYFQCTIQHLFY